MTTVASKGGFHKTLAITRNSDNTSGTMLKTPFLRKSENYSIQVAKFCTNRTPVIHRDFGPVLTIRPLTIQPPLALGVMPIYYTAEDTQFHPKKCYSTTEFVLQLQEFLHRFGFTFFRLGLEPNTFGGFTALELAEQVAPNERATSAFYFTQTNFREVGIVPDNIGYDRYRAGTSEAGARIVTCRLSGDSMLQFVLSPLFAANFFIDVSAAFQRQMGLEPHMFLIEQANGARVFQGFDITSPLVGTRVVPTSSQTFESRFAIENLDERLSLDLQVTFPNSNKILILNGKEEHEYILARFPYNNLKKFTSKLIETSSSVQDIVILDETFGAGLVDLTHGNSDYESNYLLNGDMQQITVSLITRYFEDGEIERIPAVMDDGLWYLRLIFAKKI